MKLAALIALRKRVVAPPADTPPPVRDAHRSHVGHIRAINEDRLLARPDRALWAVADGMGGHKGGAAAATMAIDALNALADRLAAVDATAILVTLESANRAIYAGAASTAAVSGTTIVVASLNADGATICWAGDSRAYRIREGRAERLTRDHSFVQELVDAGALDEAAADSHPRANVVTRALGVAAEVRIDTVRVALSPGDRLLLCSDGISRSLRIDDFRDAANTVDSIADRILTNALQRDGSDNATLVVIEPLADSPAAFD